MSKIRERAETAADKKALYGADIDFSSFTTDPSVHKYDPEMTSFSEEERRIFAEVGIVTSREERSGSFLLMDHSPVHCSVGQEGVELLPMAEALEKYDGLKDYWWKAVDVGTDKYTARVELDFNNGYFVKVSPGVKATFPAQACLYIDGEGVAQNVHNVIIAEEGSELHLITGCATAPRLVRGLHIGVTEVYIKKGATVTSTMIHNWGKEIEVRPRTVVMVEEEATFMSNYVSMKPVKSVQMYPVVRLLGKGAVARINNILVAGKGSNLDVGGRVSLEAAGTKAEIISRTISTGGDIIARGQLIGHKPGVKAHLECNGLMLAEEGSIRAIPELDGRVAGVEMSHEAAVGKISQDQIEYLMARGLSEEEATALIVRGFLNVKMEGLPEELQVEIDRIVFESEKSIL
ncbi:MAG: SufD family Fe-S cluster assembly protein [Deltaproteobacteria bacterium]|nr:SufD family Fe-S cluster assembly protein [Deltaproteobacteria bacterium]